LVLCGGGGGSARVFSLVVVVVVSGGYLWWWSQVPFSGFGWWLEFADGLPAGLVAGGVEGP
jgi:hypothetical protein